MDGAYVKRYVPGARTDEIVAVEDGVGAATTYPLQDGLANTVAVVDARGQVDARFRYAVTGEPALVAGSLGSGADHRFLFTGREWLAPFGISDHRNRYYHTATGRWLTTDPIGFSGGRNLYEYVGNQVTNAVDPLGLATETFHAAVQYLGYETTFVDGSWVWSCVKGSETSQINLSPGLTGFTGVGYTYSGATLGFTFTLEQSNSSRFEPCSGSCKKYVVDMKVVLKKKLGAIISMSEVMHTLTKQVDCPCY